MLDLIASCEAIFLYFGGSVFLLSLILWFVPHCFKLGVITMIIADVALAIAIACPRKMTEYLIEQGFDVYLPPVEQCALWGIVTGVGFFVICLLLHLLIFVLPALRRGKSTGVKYDKNSPQAQFQSPSEGKNQNIGASFKASLPEHHADSGDEVPIFEDMGDDDESIFAVESGTETTSNRKFLKQKSRKRSRNINHLLNDDESDLKELQGNPLYAGVKPDHNENSSEVRLSPDNAQVESESEHNLSQHNPLTGVGAHNADSALGHGSAVLADQALSQVNIPSGNANSGQVSLSDFINKLNKPEILPATSDSEATHAEDGVLNLTSVPKGASLGSALDQSTVSDAHGDSIDIEFMPGSKVGDVLSAIDEGSVPESLLNSKSKIETAQDSASSFADMFNSAKVSQNAEQDNQGIFADVTSDIAHNQEQFAQHRQVESATVSDSSGDLTAAHGTLTVEEALDQLDQAENAEVTSTVEDIDAATANISGEGMMSLSDLERMVELEESGASLDDVASDEIASDDHTADSAADLESAQDESSLDTMATHAEEAQSQETVGFTSDSGAYDFSGAASADLMGDTQSFSEPVQDTPYQAVALGVESAESGAALTEDSDQGVYSLVDDIAIAEETQDAIAEDDEARILGDAQDISASQEEAIASESDATALAAVSDIEDVSDIASESSVISARSEEFEPESGTTTATTTPEQPVITLDPDFDNPLTSARPYEPVSVDDSSTQDESGISQAQSQDAAQPPVESATKVTPQKPTPAAYHGLYEPQFIQEAYAAQPNLGEVKDSVAAKGKSEVSSDATSILDSEHKVVAKSGSLVYPDFSFGFTSTPAREHSYQVTTGPAAYNARYTANLHEQSLSELLGHSGASVSQSLNTNLNEQYLDAYQSVDGSKLTDAALSTQAPPVSVSADSAKASPVAAPTGQQANLAPAPTEDAVATSTSTTATSASAAQAANVASDTATTTIDTSLAFDTEPMVEAVQPTTLIEPSVLGIEQGATDLADKSAESVETKQEESLDSLTDSDVDSTELIAPVEPVVQVVSGLSKQDETTVSPEAKSKQASQEKVQDKPQSATSSSELVAPESLDSSAQAQAQTKEALDASASAPTPTPATTTADNKTQSAESQATPVQASAVKAKDLEQASHAPTKTTQDSNSTVGHITAPAPVSAQPKTTEEHKEPTAVAQDTPVKTADAEGQNSATTNAQATTTTAPQNKARVSSVATEESATTVATSETAEDEDLAAQIIPSIPVEEVGGVDTLASKQSAVATPAATTTDASDLSLADDITPSIPVEPAVELSLDSATSGEGVSEVEPQLTAVEPAVKVDSELLEQLKQPASASQAAADFATTTTTTTTEHKTPAPAQTPAKHQANTPVHAKSAPARQESKLKASEGADTAKSKVKAEAKTPAQAPVQPTAKAQSKPAQRPAPARSATLVATQTSATPAQAPSAPTEAGKETQATKQAQSMQSASRAQLSKAQGQLAQPSASQARTKSDAQQGVKPASGATANAAATTPSKPSAQTSKLGAKPAQPAPARQTQAAQKASDQSARPQVRPAPTKAQPTSAQTKPVQSQTKQAQTPAQAKPTKPQVNTKADTKANANTLQSKTGQAGKMGQAGSQVAPSATPRTAQSGTGVAARNVNALLNAKNNQGQQGAKPQQDTVKAPSAQNTLKDTPVVTKTPAPSEAQAPSAVKATPARSASAPSQQPTKPQLGQGSQAQVAPQRPSGKAVQPAMATPVTKEPSQTTVDATQGKSTVKTPATPTPAAQVAPLAPATPKSAPAKSEGEKTAVPTAAPTVAPKATLASAPAPTAKTAQPQQSAKTKAETPAQASIESSKGALKTKSPQAQVATRTPVQTQAQGQAKAAPKTPATQAQSATTTGVKVAPQSAPASQAAQATPAQAQAQKTAQKASAQPVSTQATKSAQATPAVQVTKSAPSGQPAKASPAPKASSPATAQPVQAQAQAKSTKAAAPAQSGAKEGPKPTPATPATTANPAKLAQTGPVGAGNTTAHASNVANAAHAAKANPAQTVAQLSAGGKGSSSEEQSGKTKVAPQAQSKATAPSQGVAQTASAKSAKKESLAKTLAQPKPAVQGQVSAPAQVKTGQQGKGESPVQSVAPQAQVEGTMSSGSASSASSAVASPELATNATTAKDESQTKTLAKGPRVKPAGVVKSEGQKVATPAQSAANNSVNPRVPPVKSADNALAARTRTQLAAKKSLGKTAPSAKPHKTGSEHQGDSSQELP